MPDGLQRKVKMALDETRLLILGAQILLGFQFAGTFSDLFDELPQSGKALHAVAFGLLVVTVGLLIAPSLQHRIVEQGRDSTRIPHVAGSYAAVALVPLAIGLGIAIYNVLQHLYGTSAGIAGGAGFTIIALVFWFGIGVAKRKLKTR